MEDLLIVFVNRVYVFTKIDVTEKGRLHSNIESKSLNNTYLNIIEIFNKLFKKLNIIKSRNLITTLT